MGAVDYFLKMTGVEGESLDSMHRGDIEIENWSFGESQTGTAMFGSGMGAGKITMDDFTFTKRTDKSTPTLMVYCASGKVVDTATFFARKAGGETGPLEYLKVVFSKCIISNYQTAGTKSTDIVPRESISFCFSKVEITYCPQNPDGSLGGQIHEGYDLKETRRV